MVDSCSSQGTLETQSKTKSAPDPTQPAPQSLQRDGGGPPCKAVRQSATYLRQQSLLHITRAAITE